MRLPPTRTQLFREVLSQLRQWEKDKTQLHITLSHGVTMLNISGKISEAKEDPGVFIFGNLEKEIFFSANVTQFHTLAVERSDLEVVVYLDTKAHEVLTIAEEREPHALVRSLIRAVPKPKKTGMQKGMRKRS